jgi:hypothetical protein
MKTKGWRGKDDEGGDIKEEDTHKCNTSMTMSYWQLTRPPPGPLWLGTSKFQNSIHFDLTQHLVPPWYVKSSWVFRISFNFAHLSTVPQFYVASLLVGIAGGG